MIRTALTLSMLMAAPALAESPRAIVSPAADQVAVTIYRDNLALITETRTVDLPGGPVKLAFAGVLDSVIPQSAIVRGLEGAETERNFDFDGLSPRSLLWRSIGERVQVVRSHRKRAAAVTEDARIAAAGNGVVLQYDGRVEALGCGGLPERIVFPKIPDGLRPDPTLSTTIDAPAGKRTVTVSYLATGLSWSADYVVTLAPGARSADVRAWVTLTNGGERGFPQSQVSVVAGDLARVAPPRMREFIQAYAGRACWAMGNTTSNLPRISARDYEDIRPTARMMAMAPPPPPPPPPAPMMAEDVMVTGAKVAQEDLGDYKLYRLTAPTDLAANQTKQVMFLTKDAATPERLHRLRLGWASPRGDDGPRQTEVLLRFKNVEDRGLGAPLPEGTARVMAPARGGLFYLGSDDKKDTAIGLDWELSIGASPSVTAQRRLISRKETKLRDGRVRIVDTISVDVANALPTATTLELQQMPVGASLKVTNASAPWRMKDGDVTWSVPVAAGGETRVTYTLRYVRG
ncbi:MAG: hypothetical protein KJS97_04520 [Alphaproteobacteria bacterium]|nr:hypothetical protein [Alphaproteobacteria bacterium]